MADASTLPSPDATAYRLYRTALDGDRSVFSTATDAQIPLEHGVTVLCGDNRDVTALVDAATLAGLSALVRRGLGGPRVLIEDRRTQIEAAS